MIWKIWNWPTNECLPAVFDSYQEAKGLCMNDLQLVVSMPSTKEDEMYMGEGEIWCNHALHPTECLHCNPDFRDMFMYACPCCGHDTGLTWHLPLTEKRALALIYDEEAKEKTFLSSKGIAKHALVGDSAICQHCGFLWFDHRKVS